MSEWKGQIALVTGATGAIGGAVADALASLGATVAASDVRAAPIRHRFATVDIRASEQVEKWVQQVCKDIGPPTIAVICAGRVAPGRLAGMSDAAWRDVMAVNLDGAFYTARAAIRAMIAGGGGGRIVFVGSWAAHAPHPQIGAYSASKAALRMLGRTLALDHAADGILVNEVAPGIVDAGLSKALFDADPALAAQTRAAIPTQGLVRPEDVARDVVFLASPHNRHTTGTVLTVDGGLSLTSAMTVGGKPAS